jgi:hypothetical protein
MGKKMDIEVVKAEIAKRCYTYNYHYYKGGRLWINISCPDGHGPEDRTWSNFQQGFNCYACGREKVIKVIAASRVDIEIVKAEIARRGYTYNYHYYKDGKLWINITCPDNHATKDRTWMHFKNGKGCYKCGGSAKIDEQVIISTISEKGYTYNYHYYKDGKLWVNASCPDKDHPVKDRRWNQYQREMGCWECYVKRATIYKNEASRKFAQNARARFRIALKDLFKTKKVSAVKDLGCTIEEAVKHIESKFYTNPETGEEMNWGNYGRGSGKWSIDHIKPLARCNLDTVEGQREAVHYTNLQPLWEFDNLSKGAKWNP